MKIIMLFNHLRYPFSDQDGTEEAKAWHTFARWAGLAIACVLLGFVLAQVLG
jgi:hypothetical protein